MSEAWVVNASPLIAARRCAAAHGVPIIGTLGVVLRSKERGLLHEARPIVRNLIDAGMFLNEQFAEQALKSVGE